MGLDDREYMREVPIYRALVGRGGSRVPPSDEVAGTRATPLFPVRPRPARARPWVWYLVGVAGVVAVLAFALLNRPANPAGVAQPLSTHASFPVKLPAHVVRDSTLTLAGSLSAYSEGAVTVEGQWTGGPWIVLGTGALHPDGAYRVSVNLHWQGLVQLKVELPDGSVGTGTIAVT